MIKQDLREVFSQAFPIMFGYLPLGGACGLLLAKAGMPIYLVALMSLLVFGGSAQFVAGSLLLAGAPYYEILAMVVLLNSRQIILTSSLIPYLKEASRTKTIILSQLTADESYAVNISNFRNKKKWTVDKAILLAFICYLFWFIFTVMGAWLGSYIAFDLDILSYVLIAVFIALLVPMIHSWRIFKVVMMTSILSLILMLVFKNTSVMILAAVLGATFGTWLDRKEVALW